MSLVRIAQSTQQRTAGTCLPSMARRVVSSTVTVPKVQPNVTTQFTTTRTFSSKPEGKFLGEPDEVVEIDSTIRMKNSVMAVTLLSFCAGVAWYSMNAVGQSGTDKSDPLAVLKQEAAAAQIQQDRNQAEEAESANMVRQFQAGEFDPDKIEDDDELDEKSNRKPWWKVW